MSKSNWINTSPNSGNNNGSIQVTVQANNGDSRQGSIVVSGEGLSKTINVNQNEEQENDLTLNFKNLINRQVYTSAARFKIQVLAGESLQTVKAIGVLDHHPNYSSATKFPTSIRFKAKKSKVMVKLVCIANNISYHSSIDSAGGKILKLRANGTVIGQGEILVTGQVNNCSFDATLIEIGQWSDSNSYELDYGI